MMYGREHVQRKRNHVSLNQSEGLIMKIIRKRCFETNSSSCHSISLVKSDESWDTNGCLHQWAKFLESEMSNFATLDIHENDSQSSFLIELPIIITGGTYGWEFERLFDIKKKLNYAFTSLVGANFQSKEHCMSSDEFKKFQSTFKSFEFFSLDEFEEWEIPQYVNIKVEFKFDIDWDEYRDSYIDHDSVGLLDDMSEDELRRLVFDPRNSIILDANG